MDGHYSENQGLENIKRTNEFVVQCIVSQLSQIDLKLQLARLSVNLAFNINQ